MPGVVLEQLRKEFAAGVVAVNDLDLEVNAGELVVLVGPSGCGKTTTLRMVAGLEQVTRGTVRIGDRVVTDLPPRQRDIAMVFQNYALYPHMSVRRNIGFGLRMAGAPKDEIDASVDYAARLLGIGDLLQRRPRELSGGQRQRVAMGRAIVREPAAFLMDEPLSNLDAKLRVQMRAEIASLQRRLGTTTLYVTHDQTEAMTMGDRVAILNRGELQQYGSPREVYEQPRNVFVAGFIGSPAMNIARARLEREDGRCLVVLSDLRLHLSDSVLQRRDGLAKRVGGEVMVGVRPEDLDDARFASGGNERQLWQVTVKRCEPLGAEVIAHFDVETPPAPLRAASELSGAALGAVVEQSATMSAQRRDQTTFTARLNRHTTARDGRPLSLAVDVEQLHFFDAATGEAIR